MTDKNYAPICDGCEEHPELIEKSREAIPEVEKLYDLSDFFKIFGDSTRLGILFAIDKAPMCVCDISAANRGNSLTNLVRPLGYFRFVVDDL